MEHLRLFSELFNESLNNDVLDLAKDCMVDLIDKGFDITNVTDSTIQRGIFISKKYFYWEDVEEEVIRFINIFEKVKSISITYEIDIWVIETEEDFYDINSISFTVDEVLSGKVKTRLSSINDEVNYDDVNLLRVRIFY